MYEIIRVVPTRLCSSKQCFLREKRTSAARPAGRACREWDDGGPRSVLFSWRSSCSTAARAFPHGIRVRQSEDAQAVSTAPIGQLPKQFLQARWPGDYRPVGQATRIKLHQKNTQPFFFFEARARLIPPPGPRLNGTHPASPSAISLLRLRRSPFITGSAQVHLCLFFEAWR